ncbi:MAG: TRAP transporter small permease [Moorellales bacterium]
MLKLIRTLDRFGAAVGGIFLIAMVVLTVVTVLSRLSGVAMPGSYELLVLLVVIPVGFALFGSTWAKRHVVIESLVEHLPQRARAVLDRWAWAVSLLWWILTAWAAFDITLDKGLQERTEVLNLPFLPFRLVWIFGLTLVCIASLLHLLKVREREGDTSQ